MQITRGQRLAALAYEHAAKVEKADKAVRDFKTLVNGFGPNVIRSGLSATMSWLEREKSKREKAVAIFLGYLAAAHIAGLPADVSAASLPSVVRGLPVADYMLATRDALRLAIWLKRAFQAEHG